MHAQGILHTYRKLYIQMPAYHDRTVFPTSIPGRVRLIKLLLILRAAALRMYIIRN